MKNIKEFIYEFFMGVLGVLGTTIDSKMSIGIFLLILSLGFIFSPIGDFSHKEGTIMKILGFILLIFSVLLFIIRFKEIKRIK